MINVSNPYQPIEVGYYDTRDGASGVAVSGNYVYMTYDYAGFRVIDVSNPTNPHEVGYLDTRSQISDIKLNGYYAYLTSFQNGLRVLDVSSPAQPVEVGYYDMGGAAFGVTVSDAYIYVAYLDYGLYILEFLTNSHPPGSPILSNPPRNYSSIDNTPLLIWQIPGDVDGDSLHFKVEISMDSCFYNQVSGSPFESQHGVDGFIQTLPVSEGIGRCIFTPTSGLANGDYWWRVSAWDGKGFGEPSESWKFTVLATFVGSRQLQLPTECALFPNYPNPFNLSTMITYTLPEARKVLLQIFDLNGRIVTKLVDNFQNAGFHSITWNAVDEAGTRIASGIYLCQLTIDELVLTGKLILIK